MCSASGIVGLPCFWVQERIESCLQRTVLFGIALEVHGPQSTVGGFDVVGVGLWVQLQDCVMVDMQGLVARRLRRGCRGGHGSPLREDDGCVGDVDGRSFAVLHGWVGRGTHGPWTLQDFGAVTLVVKTSFGPQRAEGPGAHLRRRGKDRI